MAIAIPLIGGVREAANNAKCRSNLKQLHTAIIAYATGYNERLPNLAGSSNLDPLIQGGYIESESKLGICPGDPDKSTRTLPDSSYQGGPDLDGMKKLSHADITSQSIVLEDNDIGYHKAGKNAIRMDGSFGPPSSPLPPPWWEQVEALPLGETVETIGVALNDFRLCVWNGDNWIFNDPSDGSIPSSEINPIIHITDNNNVTYGWNEDQGLWNPLP